MLTKSKFSTKELILTALVAGIYVAVTLVFAPISFGPIQLRIAEIFNILVIYNRRYILSVTLGVFISNIASPLGPLDVIWGSAATCITLIIIYLVVKNITNENLKLAYCVVIVTFSMFTVALELFWILHYPFWITFGTVAAGEFIVMCAGALIFKIINTNRY